ncbi:MAG: hypothetical protein Q7S74_00915 [Nanoarchaeota archaeon]|nr:hypothetical protein [Nanoarchaeota archaeon]
MKVIVQNLAKYESFIIVGILMTIGTILKLSGVYEFSSDWFWLLAGVGLIVEGAISLAKQRKFDRKYKIIEIDPKDCDKK